MVKGVLVFSNPSLLFVFESNVFDPIFPIPKEEKDFTHTQKKDSYTAGRKLGRKEKENIMGGRTIVSTTLAYTGGYIFLVLLAVCLATGASSSSLSFFLCS